MLDPSAPYTPFQLPCVVVSWATKLADAGTTGAPPKNRPEITAFVGLLLMTLKVVPPLTFHTRYTPFWKLEIDWLLRMIPVASSITWIVSLRPWLSQSTA